MKPDTLSRGDVIYASIVAFVAWLFAVYDYTIFGTLLPLIAKDFSWSPETVGRVTIWISIGVFFVSVGVGPLVDRLGRKPAMIITCVGAALSSGLAGFTTGVIYLVAVRALSGFGYSECAVNSAYLNEIYGSKRRGLLYSFIQGGWPIGVLFGAALTAALQPYLGWRQMFWVATFPAIVISLLAIRLKESPHFLRLKAVERLAKSGEAEKAKKLGQEYGISTEGIHLSTYTQLFRKDLRCQSLTLMGAFLLNWAGLMVFIILGTTILTEGLHVNYHNSLMILIVSNVVTYAGYVLMGYIGDLIGRKITIGVSWLASALTYIIMLFFAHSSGAILLAYTFGLFFLIGPYSALFTYLGKSFPARVRGTGITVINAMGPLGAILGSALYTTFLHWGADIQVAAAFAGGAMIALSGVVILFARTISPGQELEAIAG